MTSHTIMLKDNRELGTDKLTRASLGTTKYSAWQTATYRAIPGANSTL
jgi:hypothetical protein